MPTRFSGNLNPLKGLVGPTFLRSIVVGQLCMFSALSIGQMYEWTDEQGRKHFSDKKPRHSNTDNLTKKEMKQAQVIDTSGEDQRAYQQRQDRLSRVLEEERLIREKEQQEVEAKKQAQRNQCEQLRKEIEENKAANLYEVDDENGGKRIMSDAERDEYDQKIQAVYDKECT